MKYLVYIISIVKNLVHFTTNMLPFDLAYLKYARTPNGGRIGVPVLRPRYHDEEREAEERRQRRRDAEELQRLRDAEERRQRRRDAEELQRLRDAEELQRRRDAEELQRLREAERLRREARKPRLCGGVIVISSASARPSASAPSSSGRRFTGHGVPHYSSSSSSSSGVHCRYYNGIEGSCFYGLQCRYIHDSESKCNCTRDNCLLSH